MLLRVLHSNPVPSYDRGSGHPLPRHYRTVCEDFPLTRLLSTRAVVITTCAVNHARMYTEPGAPHYRPHFHAYYQDAVAVYAVDTIELIGGSLPRRQQRLVEAWAELHQDELLANWERLQGGRPPVRVAPLK